MASRLKNDGAGRSVLLGLARRLVDPAFFRCAWLKDEYYVRRLWARIESSSDLRMVDVYMP